MSVSVNIKSKYKQIKPHQPNIYKLPEIAAVNKMLWDRKGAISIKTPAITFMEDIRIVIITDAGKS